MRRVVEIITGRVRGKDQASRTEAELIEEARQRLRAVERRVELVDLELRNVKREPKGRGGGDPCPT